MRKNRGFSLVELIIVIAIMAVLTAVLVPSYLKYVSSSRERVCQTNRSELEQECLMEIVFQGGVSGVEEAKQIMADVLTAQGKTADAEGQYAGVCPAKGTLSVGCDESGYYPYLTCSEHGAPAQGTTETKFLQSLTDLYNNTQSATAWTNYWIDRRLQNGASLDSTGTNFGIPLAEALKKNGVDLSNASWSIYRKNIDAKGADDCFNVYFAAQDISALAIGTEVTVTRYDMLTQTNSQVTVKVKSKTVDGKTYNVLDTDAYNS